MIFSQLSGKAHSILQKKNKKFAKLTGLDFEPNIHGNSQHPADVRSLRSRWYANGREMARSRGREENTWEVQKLKEEDSSLAHPERSNMVSPRNLNPNSKFHLQLRLLNKQNRDDFSTGEKQCTLSLSI